MKKMRVDIGSVAARTAPRVRRRFFAGGRFPVRFRTRATIALDMKTLAIVALANFYLLGVMLVFQRVVYPSFGDVARAELPAYYAAFTSRIAMPVVVPEFLAVLMVVPLFFTRPPSVPAWAVGMSLAAGIVYMIITFGWHLPVHHALGAGDNSPAVVRSLLLTNALRTAVQAAKCALITWMLVKA